MRRARAPFLAIALALGVGLSGCASDYGTSIANDLRSHVLSVTTAAAEGDAAGALVLLDEFAARLADALARGEITEARHASVLAALELVRADLEALLAPAEEHQEAPPETGGEAPPDDGGGSGNGNEGNRGNEGDNGNGNPGHGNGNPGNGNGNEGNGNDGNGPPGRGNDD